MTGAWSPGLAGLSPRSWSRHARRSATLRRRTRSSARQRPRSRRWCPQKAGTASWPSSTLTGVRVHQACYALGVSASGYYEWKTRAPSARSIRHAWLADLIGQARDASYGTYGQPRARGELQRSHGLVAGHNTVMMLMRQAGTSGLPLRRRAKRVPAQKTVTDLVKRQFTADGPSRPWVTDITGHPTREGKVCCCVVIDVLPSLGTVGGPCDNAVVESFWGRMQVELLSRQRWRTRVELANAIFEYIERFHNRRRRHSALGWASPLEFETEHRHQAATPQSPFR